jgi:phosphatidylserine/phosphatidylglycerophosphate/cardiolipin synthase-like enzyme/membrane protein DedA with SNARE-associated domain
MGSVLYLDRGMRRKGAASAAAKIQATHGTQSLLRPGYNCWAAARAERVAFLVDAADYFKAFTEAALRAKRSITVLAWDFNSQTRLHFDPVEPDGPPALLGEFLNYLVQRRHSLHVHVLNWDYPMVFGADRELPPLYGFGWTPARRVHLRYDDTHPFAGCQHQKIVVIDDAVAFVGGIDLTVRRWDTPEHAADDPRRVAYGTPYPPFHDLMVALDGEAARSLAALTRERWLAATGQKLKPVTWRIGENDPWPASFPPDLQHVEVGIARTAPSRAEQPAVREVEKLYLDMIAAARKTLYIENQYFTAPRLGAALEKRLAEPDGPEVVLVLRLLSHGWLEEHTMHVLRTRLIDRLRKADHHGRFHVYYPHVPGLADGCCLDVHSKLMVVDDRVLRIGSSNLCNRSLGLDTEADIAIEARGRPQVANAIRRFRDRMLAEHLGVPIEKVRVEIERTGSLHGAIKVLAHDGRSMRELDGLPEWSDAIVNVAAVADPDEPIALDELFLERQHEEPAEPERPAWAKLALIALLILGLTALWRWSPLAHTVSADTVIGWAKDFGARWWAPLVVMASYTPACMVMFPRPLITLAAVIAFGPWLGFLYALTGIVASSIVTYYIGRRMRRDTVRRLAGPQLDRMIEVLKKYGLLAMTLLRLVPLAPFVVESIVAGAIHMRVWHVALGTAIGLLPGTLATTIFGDAIETALTGTGDVNWWLVGLAVGLLAGGIVAVKRWFTKMSRRIHAAEHAAAHAANEPALRQPG